MEKTKTNKLLYGNPLYAILEFSVFFIIGDLFQQLYNAVDSVIVGRFVSTQALAAIGVASPIMSLIMYMITGFAIGSGIVFSRWFGKGDYDTLKKCLSTALIIGLAFTLFVTVLSLSCCKPFLIFLNTPKEIMQDTSNYLYIVFAANIFTFLYNFYCYGIRAIGNSFMPLVFLIASVFINAVLDLLFVIGFNMGIEGAALATLIAQLISVIMVILYTNKKIPILKLTIKEIKFDKSHAKEILAYSSTVALQQTFVYIGRIAVQGLVNTYGTNTIAGINVAEKLNAILQTPFRGYCNASTTYYAQNQGAGKYERIWKGYLSTYFVVALNAIIMTTIGMVCANPLVSLFVEEGSQTAIDVGVGFVSAMAMGYLFMSLIIQKQSFMRGIGMLKAFFASTVVAIFCRIIFSYLFNHFLGIKGVYFAVPCSWIVGSIFNLICCIFGYMKVLKPKMIEEKSLELQSKKLS